MQNNFSVAFSLVKQQFVKVIETMDSIKLFGNFSILEFFIALLVLGAILPIVIITVANWSSNSLSATWSYENKNRELVAAQKKVKQAAKGKYKK